MPSMELGKNCPSVCATNSIVPILLRSPPTDCTLYEFMVLSVKFLQDAAIQCYAHPSEYHLTFPNAARCKRLDIVFKTYADLCQALQIDASTREAGVYREKKNRRRNTISVQVLGVKRNIVN